MPTPKTAFAGFSYPKRVYIMPKSTPRTPWRKRELRERTFRFPRYQWITDPAVLGPDEPPCILGANGLRMYLVEDLVRGGADEPESLQVSLGTLEHQVLTCYGILRAAVFPLPSRRGFLAGFLSKSDRGVCYERAFPGAQEAAEEACAIIDHIRAHSEGEDD